jgi:hypothetical protein
VSPTGGRAPRRRAQRDQEQGRRQSSAKNKGAREFHRVKCASRSNPISPLQSGFNPLFVARDSGLDPGIPLSC